MHGTDHGCESEGHYPALILLREKAQDARYAVRAWSRGFAWLALFAALGMTFTALGEQDWDQVALGLVAVALVFCPHINPRVTYEVIRTEFMRRGLLSQSPGEVLVKPASQPVKRGKTYVRPEFHITEDQ